MPPHLVSMLGQIEYLKAQWVSNTKLSPQILNRLKKSVLVTSTGASTRIEGSRLSNEEVDRLMQGLSFQTFANRDEQEVKGYFELLQNIFQAWDTLRLTEGAIKHLHQELLKYVDKDVLHRGDYKHKENQVRLIDPQGRDLGILFDTTPAYLTPSEMSDLVQWTREALQNYHPLLVIGNFIVEFLNIHPFEDGNGRLSRILTNLLLLQAGFAFMPYVSHEALIENRKVEYYRALRESQRTFKTEDESVEAWLTFFLSVVLEQAKQAIALLSYEDIERLLSPKQLIVWRYLQDHPNASRSDIVSQTGIVTPTVNQALKRLLELKRIERVGSGPGTRYRVL